jgi:threonine dehydratase
VEVPRTLLDGQQTSHIGEVPLATLRQHGVRVVGVTDQAALDAVAWAATRMKQVLEPSGAAALAAVLDGTIDVAGRRVGLVLSGGNVTPEVLTRALAHR